jgi:hypothetical protein
MPNDIITRQQLFRVLGRDYPVIAEFHEGWVLLAHPNGPAIAKVWDNNTNGGLLATLSRSHEDIPEKIRVAAVDHFVERTWRLLKPQFYPEAE